MELEWGPMDHMTPLILCLRLDRQEFARVVRRADDAGWSVTVARHRPFERQRRAIAPTQAIAMKWAERWVRANLQRCIAEVAPMRRLQCGVLTRHIEGA